MKSVGEGRLAPLWDFFDEFDPRVLQVLFYGFLLVWMVALLVVAWEWSWENKLVPFIAGVPTIVLLLVKIFKSVAPEIYDRLIPSIGDDDTEAESSRLQESLDEITESDEGARPRRERIVYAVRLLGWSLALPTLMYTIGFANAMVLFVFGFGLRFYETVRQAAVVTLLFSLFMYLFFWEIIGLNPWKGIFELPSIVTLLGLG